MEGAQIGVLRVICNLYERVVIPKVAYGVELFYVIFVL